MRTNRMSVLLGGLLLGTPAASGDVLDLVRERSAAEDTGTAVSPTSAPVFGSEGSVDWWVGGIAATEFRVTNLAFARGGIDWFVATDFSIGLQADLGWAATVGADGGMLVGVAPMLRWHLFHHERWTIFAELGVGVAWTTVPIPERGTRFNFTPQAGLGATYALGDGWRGRFSVGWYHMSNARTGSINPGLDAIAISVGIGRSF